jgi:hypothetical protein
MEQLYHYKVWQSDLGQYVAQRGRLSADEIRNRGGMIILERGCETPAGAQLVKASELTGDWSATGR